MRKIILTGDRPTGRLHVGHYVGSLKQRVELQNSGLYDEHFSRYLSDYNYLSELKDHYRKGGLGDVKVKKFLNSVLQEELEPIRIRRNEFSKNAPEIYNILYKGSCKAREIALDILSEVKSAMKINYFEEENIIAKRFLLKHKEAFEELVK